VTAQTSFHAGSIAKSLAALVVVDSDRRGELSLDVPCDEQGAAWSDTPRALLAQTTGRPTLLPELHEDLEAFVERVGALPRVHEPGRFSYCNAGWSALDLLLRRRTGESFEALARARLLGDATAFGMPSDAAGGHAVGASVEPVPPEYAASASAAGSRWWVTADELLDVALLHLDGDEAVRSLQGPQVAIPCATVADAWGLGWAIWERGEHRCFGWSGFTGGHRAYLRCFPDQRAAVVVLLNGAGPLFSAPGGSAAFDAIYPALLEIVGAPALPETPRRGDGRPAGSLVGRYGPVAVRADDDALVLDVSALGGSADLRYERDTGDRFVVPGEPPGSLPIGFDRELLYLGPMAIPRS
jgi:CubicO group peptidase (beta-lactamase class C family)